MLQDAASHHTSELGCLTTLRTNALKSPSRNYPEKSKYNFETKIHSCNDASPSVPCKKCNTLLQVHQLPPPAGAGVEMARAKQATLLQTTPRWNQPTLTSLVNGVDEAVETFYTLLESAIADHVPTVILRRRLPPWFDGAVRTALRLKEAAFRRLRRNSGPASQTDFDSKRRAFKTVSNAICTMSTMSTYEYEYYEYEYNEYLRKLTDDFKTNPKRYWSYLKCVTKKSSISPVLYDSNRTLVSDDQARADSLNEAFAAKFSDPGVCSFPDAPTYPIDAMNRFHVSEAAVRAALDMVSPNKACGTDNISACIITECAKELVVPLR